MSKEDNIINEELTTVQYESQLTRAYDALYSSLENIALLDDAIREFSEIIKTCKDKKMVSLARTGLAEVYSRSQNTFQLTFTLLEAAVVDNPNNLFAWRVLGNLYVAQGSLSSLTRALTCYDNCRGNPSDTTLPIDYALVCYGIGRKSEAKQELIHLLDTPIDSKTSEFAHQSAGKALVYINNCEITKNAFIVSDVASFILLKATHRIINNENYHPNILVAAQCYGMAYSLLKDVIMMTAKSYAYSSLRTQRQQIYTKELIVSSADSRSSNNYADNKLTIAISKGQLDFGLFIMHKLAQVAHVGNNFLPQNEIFNYLNSAAGWFDSGYEIFNVGDCFYSSYYTSAENAVNLFGVNISTLMGVGALASMSKRHWDNNISQRLKRGVLISENKLGYVLYDAVSLAGSDYTSFALHILSSKPDIMTTLADVGSNLFNSGSQMTTYIWSTGLLGQVVIVVAAGAAVGYVSYRAYQHYQDVDMQTKTNNARVLLFQNKYSDALTKINEAMTVRPNNVELLWLRGAAYLKENNPQAAESDFEKIIQVMPDEVNVRVNLANSQRLQGKNIAASLNYTAAIKSIDAKIKANLVAKTQNNKAEKIIEALRKGLQELQDLNLDTLLEHARRLVQLNEYSNAIPIYQELVPIAPAHFKIADELLAVRCIHHLKEKQPQEVIQLTDARQANNSLTPGLMRLRARAWLGKALTDEKSKDDSLKRAETVLRKLLEVNKDDHDAHVQLAVVLRYQNREALALTHYRCASAALQMEMSQCSSDNALENNNSLSESLTEILKQNHDAIQETQATMLAVEMAIKKDIEHQFSNMTKVIHEKNANNDKALAEVIVQFNDFDKNVLLSFSDVKERTINRFKENGIKLFQEQREEVKKYVLEEYERFSKELLPVLEKMKNANDNLKNYIEHMEKNRLYVVSMNISKQLDDFKIRLSDDQYNNLKNYIQLNLQQIDREISIKINEYNSLFVSNDNILRKAGSYLDAVRQQFEQELDKLLDDAIERNIADAWRFAIAEFVGFCLAHIVQEFFDYCSARFYHSKDLSKYLLPRWDEYKHRYPVVTSLPREVTWRNSAKPVSFREATTQAFFTMSPVLNGFQPKKIADPKPFAESTSLIIAKFKDSAISQFRETKFGFLNH